MEKTSSPEFVYTLETGIQVSEDYKPLLEKIKKTATITVVPIDSVSKYKNNLKSMLEDDVIIVLVKE